MIFEINNFKINNFNNNNFKIAYYILSRRSVNIKRDKASTKYRAIIIVKQHLHSLASAEMIKLNQKSYLVATNREKM